MSSELSKKFPVRKLVYKLKTPQAVIINKVEFLTYEHRSARFAFGEDTGG